MSRWEDIRARLDAATPGPWTLCIISEKNQHGRVEGIALDFTDTTYPDGGGFDFQSISDADADLIAHALTDLRDLLAVAEEAAKQHQHCWCAEKAAVDVEVFGCPMARALARLNAQEATR